MSEKEVSGTDQNQGRHIIGTYIVVLLVGIANVMFFGWKLLNGALHPEPGVGFLVGVVFLAIPIFAAIQLRRPK